MKTSIYHIQLNISNPKVSLPFYKKLFSYFDYKIIDESEDHIGASNGTTDFWIIPTDKKHLDKKFHRKTTGLNHISFKVSSKEDVDVFVSDFLTKNKIKTLYEGAKEFPEYREGYYAVYFEDPDRIKLEVTYIPSKNEFKGTIVEESLVDNRMLNELEIVGFRVSKEDNPKNRWHLYTVNVSKENISKISKNLKSTKWYAHFWKGKKVIAVFKDKTFTFDYDNKNTWKKAIDYGLSIGVPKEQLDFIIE